MIVPAHKSLCPPRYFVAVAERREGKEERKYAVFDCTSMGVSVAGGDKREGEEERKKRKEREEERDRNGHITAT